MKANKSTRDFLIRSFKESKISLEGNILKVIESDPEDLEFIEYLNYSIEKDKSTRRRRLEITKQVQNQNKELLESQVKNQKLMGELKDALEVAEKSKSEAMKAMEDAEVAKETALNDLDVLQKKTQYELINTIVHIALYIIIGVGLITTGLYLVSILTNKDTHTIGSTWSNMFGILLTNAFSIVGTIMGVKYANNHK